LQHHGSDAKNHAGVAKAATRERSLSHEKKSHTNIGNQKTKRRKRHGEKEAGGLQDLSLAEGENRARAAAARAVDMQALGNAAPKEIRARLLRICIGEDVEKDEEKKRNL